MSVTDDQQFCLRWNNFQAYITSQFEALRDDEDFVDVTLACEGQRLGAHKVVLSACSPFFKELFKTNPCPHPIIFMRDVEVRHVIALLEFMYAGEVNVAQAQLAGFLRTAESLQIRGLTDASKYHKDNDDVLYTESQPTSTQFTQNPAASHTSPPIRNTVLKPKQYMSQSKTTQQQHSPSRAVTSTQEKSQEDLSLLSPPPCKKTCKTDSESDRLDKLSDTADVEHTDETKSYSSQINPFAIQSNNKALHSEIDITTDLIEPKLELPDYSEDDTNHENSHSFMDVNEGHNTFTALPGGMEIIPGTSGMGDISQESQQAWDNRKLHSLDPRPCPVCGRVYSNLSNLRQHMRLIHNPTHVECPVCSKSFKTTLYLKRHLVGCRVNHNKTGNGDINKQQQPQPSQQQQQASQQQQQQFIVRSSREQTLTNGNQNYYGENAQAYCGNDNGVQQSCYVQGDNEVMCSNTYEMHNEVVNDDIIV